MHDCWLGIEKWLNKNGNTDKNGNSLELVKKNSRYPTLLDSDFIVEVVKGGIDYIPLGDTDVTYSSSSSEYNTNNNENGNSNLDTIKNKNPDHTDDFIQVLKSLNSFTRAGSILESKSVKELYRGWFKEGRDMGDWWTTTVRNLDLVQEMSDKAEVCSGIFNFFFNLLFCF